MSNANSAVMSEEYYKNKYEELLEEYQEFAYVVSHDLQSPVRQIVGFTEILLNELDGDLSEQLRCYSDMIKYAGDEAQSCIESLLEFSRLNTEDKFFKELDINEVVEQVLVQFEPKIEITNAEVTCDDLPSTIGDHSLIAHLFTHLISNALKFRSMSEKPKIHIGAEVRDGKQYYFIRDNGIGMDPEKAANSFIMFRQLNAKDAYKGSGIGLTFARKIVDIHHGEMFFETEIEKGTTVVFSLEMK